MHHTTFSMHYTTIPIQPATLPMYSTTYPIHPTILSFSCPTALFMYMYFAINKMGFRMVEELVVPSFNWNNSTSRLPILIPFFGGHVA